jgi:hypothetical protein
MLRKVKNASSDLKSQGEKRIVRSEIASVSMMPNNKGLFG